MKKNIKKILMFIIPLIILLLPLPAEDLFIRFHITDGLTEGFRLYYTTSESPYFDDEHYIESSYDEKNKDLTFRLDSSLEGKIMTLRFDLPPEESLIVIDSVSLNSGGFIKKRLSALDVFGDGKLVLVNSVLPQPVPSREIVYLSASESDPFVVFIPEVTEKLVSGFSHKFATKIIVVFLLITGVYFYETDPFGSDESKEKK